MELKPCPFCGGEAEQEPLADGDWVIECLDCAASGPVSNNRMFATSAWNRRTTGDENGQ